MHMRLSPQISVPRLTYMSNLIDAIGEVLEGEPLDEVIPALMTLIIISAQMSEINQEDIEQFALRFIREAYQKKRMH